MRYDQEWRPGNEYDKGVDSAGGEGVTESVSQWFKGE